VAWEVCHQLCQCVGAYCTMCRFGVQSCIRTSVWGFTSTSQAGLKTSVSGIGHC